MSIEERVFKVNTTSTDSKFIAAVNNAYVLGMYKLCAEIMAAYGY